MIHITDLEFRYRDGDFHLVVPEARIDRSSTVAVIGPSGTGKTTLLNLVAGISVPSSGRVAVDGVDVSGASDSVRRDFRIKNIGLVFQEFELLSYLSIFDNILLPYRINHALKLDDTVRRRADELMERVSISDKADRKVDRLSQGERQRVAVCRALVTAPSLILADEPTGNLDPKNKQRVLDIVFEYVRENKTTLVTVTHDHDLLDRFDRVIDFKDFHGVQVGREERASEAPEGSA